MEKKLTIEGMMCKHCAARVEKALRAVASGDVAVDLEGKCATVQGETDGETLRRAVEDAGYKVTAIQ